MGWERDPVSLVFDGNARRLTAGSLDVLVGGSMLVSPLEFRDIRRLLGDSDRSCCERSALALAASGPVATGGFGRALRIFAAAGADTLRSPGVIRGTSPTVEGESSTLGIS